MRNLSVFEVSGSFVDRYGFPGVVSVIAPDAPTALTIALSQWHDGPPLSMCTELRVKWAAPVYCEHNDARGNGNSYDGTLTMWECEYCRATWGKDADTPDPTLSYRAFRLYCETIAESPATSTAWDWQE